MTDSERGDEGEGGVPPELCDVCGAVLTDKTELYAFVRDSSAIHRHDPTLDGRRMVVACSPEHLQELIDQYRRRPFVDDELWAGKIYRALHRHSGEVSDVDLVAETGLSQEQVARGVVWHNLEFERWRRRFRGSDGER